MIELTEEQIQRYSRHILLQDVGVEGQEKIMNARVLVVGAGGLGAPVSLYLAAAGIGRIGIVDADVVDLSNLQRQVIHFAKDVGVPKVKSAEEKIKAINPERSIPIMSSSIQVMRSTSSRNMTSWWTEPTTSP